MDAIDFTPDAEEQVDFTPDHAPAEPVDFTPDKPSASHFLDAGPQLREAPAPTMLERVRRSLSPLLGPTETQKQEEGIMWPGPDGKLTRQYKPLGSADAREGILPALSKPAITLPRMKPSALDGDERMIGKAIYNTAAGFLEFAESPLGVVTAGAGALPAIAKGTVPITAEAIEAARLAKNVGRAGAAGFAADMASKVPAAATQAGTVSVTGTSQEATEAALGLAANVVLPGLLASHAVGEAVKSMLDSAPDRQVAPLAQEQSEFGGATPEPPPDAEVINFTPDPPEIAETSASETIPVQPISASAIATQPELMQFKRMDDPDTGVNAGDQLTGDWDDLKAGNLLLWEPKNPAEYGLDPGQKYIVANGHHRFQFGEANDVPAYNAQVVKEANGVSAGDARSLAAEINIADGKGTIYDQVKYLRNESATHGPDAAVASAGSIGIKGRQAAAIAFQAGPDLYSSFVNEQVRPEQAEAVARAAPMGSPNAEALQRLGVKQAAAGASPVALNNLIQAVRLEGRTVAPQQFDLFAADDSAIQTAQQLAKVAGKLQSAVSAEIRSTDAAAKNASTARAKGIQFDRPPEEILAENAKLKAERDRWDNWALHPDLVAQVRGYAEMDRSASAPALGENTPAKPTLEQNLSDWADRTIAEGRQRLGAGLDPTVLAAYAVKGALLIKNGVVDFGQWSAEMARQFGETVRPHLADLFRQAGGLAPGDGLRAFGQKLQTDTSIDPAVKEVIGQYTYKVGTNEENLAAAKQLIAAHGVDAGIRLLKNDHTGIPDEVRSALSGELLKQLGNAARLAKSKGDTAGESAALDKQVDVANTRMIQGTNLAKALQAMSIYDEMTPEGVLRHAKKVFGDAGDQAAADTAAVTDPLKEQFRKANDAAVQGTIADPAVNDAARQAVNEHIANSNDTRKGVIVEITGAMAESPEIIRQAREALRGQLNRILQAQPRPLGTAAKMEMGPMLNELAKRAASIAASHYQGAELGKTLAQKLQERTGLSEEAAKRLAKSLDLKFGAMVEKARNRIPQRIAEQRALGQAGAFDPNEVNLPAVDREIKRQLAAMNQRLGNLVKQHAAQVDATGRSIGDRVVTDAGLTGPRADALRQAFDQRFKILAEAAKRQALKQMESIGVKGLKPVKGALNDLLKLTNLGAFTDAKFDALVRKRLDMPALTPELSREIVRRANAVQALPAGFQRDRAATQLLNFVAQTKGVSWWDMATSVWYAHAVSGLATEAHVAIDNLGQFAGNALVNLARSPLATGDLMRAAGRGLVKGADQAREILRTGVVTGLRDQVQTSHTLEQNPFKGPVSFLNLEKYVGRVLSANHVLLFKPAMEMKSALLARDVARNEGLRGQALAQRVADILGNTEARVNAARAQAAAEGLNGLDLRRRTAEIIEQQRDAALPGLAENARQYALRSTYLQDPYGVAGFTAQKLGQYFTELAAKHPIAGTLARITTAPFMRIAGNILDEKLNWTPLGALRAWTGSRAGELYGRPITDDRAVGDLYTKAIAGTVATAALATLGTITGNGPADPKQRQQLMQTGWRPHSIKLGDHYVDYLRTPAALPLAVMGNLQDASRYRHLDDQDAYSRFGYAWGATTDTILGQSYLDSVGRLLEAAKNPNTKTAAQKWEQIAARTGSKFVVPNVINEIDRLFDPTLYDKTGIQALTTSQIPFARRLNKPVINVLGDPVQSGIFDRDVSQVKADPLWRVIADKQAWVPEPGPTIVGNKKLGVGNFRTLTPDEMYDYTLESGKRIRARLEGNLESMTDDEAKEFVRKVTGEERAIVKKTFSP